ncbi:MAG: purine-binding chemotaxis protein CheW [Anaerolineae bacterium]|nr:MAG: purine-binding chemotaxis protein CheW [Anaerolineae bacterium]
MREPYILFQVAETTYAVPSAQVQQVVMLEGVTRVPNAPDFVEGVVYVRGHVVPVVDLRARFGFERRPYDIRSRLVIVNLDERWVGMAVDSAREFCSLESDDIHPPPKDELAIRADYVVGVLSQEKRLILVLDLRRLLSAEEVETLPVTDDAGHMEKENG